MAAIATRQDAAAERPRVGQASSSGARSTLFEPGGTTLEDSILGVWEDLVAEGRAQCPVCGAEMDVAGGCDGCGARLS
jgi:tRNA(Ile2) C34 agmatinyltransferase TiaS